ncbi:MAG: hypothetical protein HQK50_15475 [Oligoflexia bacterium]|nr:hypothetical protein [Oligoflexia bacterium]MBF0366975.1 hypothetical protein [Oligoflexia bacterium]
MRSLIKFKNFKPGTKEKRMVLEKIRNFLHHSIILKKEGQYYSATVLAGVGTLLLQLKAGNLQQLIQSLTQKLG